MTRGPLPAEAIRKAMAVATGRGTVMERDFFLRFRLGFILFCAGLSVFVAVRRTRQRLTGPEECAAQFRTDILHLRRVPLTGVVARELWLLTPWGTWQYFRILDDRVIEVRSSGDPVLQGGQAVPTLVSGKAVLSDPLHADPVGEYGNGNGDPPR